ncbi:MAG: DciA family protein [Algiphilus sp.]
MAYSRTSSSRESRGSAFDSEGSQLGELLSSRTGTAGRLLARAARLQQLSEAVQAMGTPWSGQLRVANVREGAVVLFAENAGAALRAKQEARRIAERLRQAGAPCERLVVKTRPSRQPR